MKFLEYTIKDLYQRYKNRMQDLTLVLPTRRAGLFAKECLGELAGNRPACAPECTTISDLFDSLCPLKAADEVKTVCLLYNIYKVQVKTTLSLDAFYGWGRQLIADFNNIDKCAAAGITAEDILRNSMEAHHFDESNLDAEVKERIVGLFRASGVSVADEENSVRKEYEALWRQLPEIYRQLTEALQQEGCALEGARWRWVVDHIDDIAPQIEGRTFVFAGFNRLLAVERALMLRLKERGIALFYWDYDADFDKHEGEHINVYKNVRRNIRHDDTKVENLGGTYDDTAPSDSDPIEVIAAPSDNAQARYVYDWLKTHHKKGDRTAIVICNETQLEHVVFAIPSEFADNVNITKGFPLRNTRIYADIARRLHGQKGEGADFAEVLQGLLDFIDKKREEEIESDSALPWHELLNIESQWQARLVIVRFLQLVKDGTLADVREFHTLRNLLLRHLSTVSIPFHGEPITDIQIIGVLETRALDFDNILFLNVEEGVVPKVGKDNSFIPYYLRKYYGLPTNDEQTDIYAYNFFRLLRRASHVTIMYSDAQTATGQKCMSRFVMQMLVSERFSTRRRMLKDGGSLPVEPAEEQVSKMIQGMTDCRCYADRLKAMLENGRELSLSPTAIKTYLTCPMKFYVRYMLGVPEPEKADSMLQGNELGTLIHNAAQVAYESITHGYQHPLSPGDIKRFLDDESNLVMAVSKAYEMLNEDYRRWHDQNAPDFYQPDKHKVETQVALKHLKKILVNDENTPGLQIIDCEKDAYYTVNLCGLSIKIGGRIDRIDSVADGSFRIADYKTGKYKDEYMKAASLDALFEVGQSKSGNLLQTLIYCLAARYDKETRDLIPQDRKMYPVLFYTQKNLTSFNPHLYFAKEPIMDFDSIKEDFEDKLCALVEQILTTEEFPMVQKGNSSPCEYCKYKLLCGRKASRE